jgi:hypothetical protein
VTQSSNFLADVIKSVQCGAWVPAGIQRPYVWDKNNVQALIKKEFHANTSTGETYSAARCEPGEYALRPAGIGNYGRGSKDFRMWQILEFLPGKGWLQWATRFTTPVHATRAEVLELFLEKCAR